MVFEVYGRKAEIRAYDVQSITIAHVNWAKKQIEKKTESLAWTECQQGDTSNIQRDKDHIDDIFFDNGSDH